MEYTYIKGTGLKVSRFCLGTMTFGDQTQEQDAVRIIDYALDQGVNFFDTADTYTGGLSEQILGKALEGKREDAVIATKVTNPRGPLPNQSGQGRKHIMTDVEQSLRALRTDYIDLYYLHHPDPNTPVEEVIETMTNLVRSGKIRYYGMSNYSTWQCCSFIHKAREMHAVAPVVTESVYNLITRGIEDEMVPFLNEYKMGLTVFNPIAAGLLTGKHTGGKPQENSRFAINYGYAMRYFNEANLEAVERLSAIAAESGMSLLEFSLQWLMNRPAVDSLIVGASRYEHVVQNIALASEKKTLSPEAMKQCDEVWDMLKGHYFSYHANARPMRRPPEK
ncbi:MAG: aldo/keto reductase [Lachnospiraceae bacterium]|nr:aldo/keto reductase [Lachnospiraceae bacterium]